MKRRRDFRATPPPPSAAANPAAPSQPRVLGWRVAPSQTGSGPSLGDLLWAILLGRWIIVATTVAALAAALAYLAVATPIYTSILLLQVDDRAKAAASASDVTALLDASTSVETSMEAMRSRSLLGSVVDELGLDIDVRPPLAARWRDDLWRRIVPPDPSSFSVGPGRYARGGTRVAIQRLTLPAASRGLTLLLRAGGDGRYTLESDDGAVRLAGVAGALAASGSGEERAEVLVTTLSAPAGTTWLVRTVGRAHAVEAIQGSLQIQEKGRKTGLVQLSLAGPDPTVVARTLGAVARAYQGRNVADRSAEASSTLEFLESQLPVLKANMEGAEASLDAFRRSRGTIDLSREATLMVERTAGVERALSDLEMQRAELRQRFTADHPSVASIDRKVEALRAELASTHGRLRNMPETERDSVRLMREVKVASELYAQLLNKVQELRIVKMGTIGSVRVVDEADIPERPGSPQRLATLLLALLVGAGAGVAFVIVRHGLDEGLDDPHEIEAATGIPVLVTIPHSESQTSRAPGARPGASSPRPILASFDPRDPSVEALRSLRTALELAPPESDRNVIAVSSPGPGVGKSFVSLNLAFVLATGGRRVVLVDGDLRRGMLHDHFNLTRQPGLSDVVVGGATLDEALRASGVERLDFLSTGAVPDHPSELLASARLDAVLDELSRRFDVVVVDTPPALAVSDSTLLARHAGVTLVVLRAGQHSAREIQLTLDRLQRGGARVTATVLNDARSLLGRYGRYGHQSRYEYHHGTSA